MSRTNKSRVYRSGERAAKGRHALRDAYDEVRMSARLIADALRERGRR